MSNALKKIGLFFASFLWLVGAVGSLGYILWMKQWVIAVGLAVVIFGSYPSVKKWVNALINE